MPYYGQQEDQQMGPFTAPIMAKLRALRIVSAIQAINDQEEDRKLRREVVKMRLDSERRNALREDFETGMLLRQAGAMPAGPSDTGESDAMILGGTFGPGPENYRPRVVAPSRLAPQR